MLLVGVIVLYAQEPINLPDLTFPHNSDTLAMLPSPSLDPETGGNDLRYDQLLSHNRNITYTNILPLAAREAEINGVTATPGEISAQEQAFKAMYPGMPVSRKQLRDQVIATKFSETLNVACISYEDIKNLYKQMQWDFPDGNAPAIATVLPMLRMRAILENKSIQDKMWEFSELHAHEDLLKVNATWSVEDMRIQGRDNGCIAERTDSHGCLLTVKQYNDCIMYYTIPKRYPLDSSRVYAARYILEDSYIADKARANGFAESDSVAGRIKKWKQDYVRMRKTSTLGKLVTDHSSLSENYSRFYDALFRRREYPHYSIIGSSDSLFIDSILQICRPIMSPYSQHHKGKKENTTSSTSASAIPWSHSHSKFLPTEFGKAADTLHINGVSPVIKTLYGFFLVRLDSIQKRYEIPFHEAKEQLIILATKRKWFNMDSLLLAKADSLYESDERLNHVPDTLTVMALLTPEIVYESIQDEETAIKKSKQDIKTDSLVSGMQILSAYLPSDVRDSLLNRYEISHGREKMIGPIHSRYGVWNFEVVGRKRKGGVRRFSTIKKQLIDSLVVHEVNCGVDLSWEKPDSAFDRMALARSYEPYFFGVSKHNGPDKKYPDHHARESLHKKIRDRKKTMDAWFSKITINYPVLANSSK